MNVTVSKKDLLHVASRALGIADRKSTMPVLAMVKLDAKGDTIHISATDLYRSMVDRIPAEVDGPGKVAVSAKDLVDRVKALPDGPVAITASDKRLTLKAKGIARKFTLPMLDGADFPPIAEPDADAARLTLDASVLARLIALTDFSASPDQTRPHLNSVLLEWQGTILRMVSTDGHRLSKAEVSIDNAASAEMLIPLNGIQVVAGIAKAAQGKDDPGTIELISAGNTAFFLHGSTRIGVRLTDATFPPYKQVIPTGQGQALRVPRSALADAVRAVALATMDKSGTVKFAAERGKLLLTGESPDSGDASDEIAVEYAGPKMAVGVNARYMNEVLAALKADEIEIALIGELDPIVVRPADRTQDAGYVGVIMPVRI